MNWIGNLLIIGGVSLDVFATMESQGSLVAKIEKKGLAGICGLVCLWQILAFSAGGFVSSILIQKDRIAEKEQFIGNGAAVIIFAGLGMHLMIKAIRNEKLNERREESFNKNRIFQGMAGTGVYTFFAGIAFGFVESNRMFDLAYIIGFSILAVITGTYTGYHFGFAQRRRAYGAGAVLLWIAGADVFIRLLR